MSQIFGKIFRKHKFQMLYFNRFGQIVIKTGFQIEILGSYNSVCRKSYNHGTFGDKILLLEDLKSFYAVHFRHHMIQKDYMIKLYTELLYALFTGKRKIGNNAVLLHEIFGNFTVHLVIVNNKNPCGGCIDIVAVNFLPYRLFKSLCIFSYR